MMDTLAIKADLERLGSELRSEIGALGSELRTEIGALRAELHREIGSLRSEMREMETRLTVRLGGMMVAVFGVLAVLVEVL